MPKNIEREIIGRKPRFPGYLENSRTLSQILAEDELREAKERPKRKVPQVKKRVVIPCSQCDHWIKATGRCGSIPKLICMK